MPRILIAGLFHETHSFVTGTTSLSDFTTLVGVDLAACRGDASPMGGVLDAAADLGWDIVPAADMRAMPGGIVDSDVIVAWMGHFEAAAKSAGSIDGVFLVLHGAMISASELDVEGALLARIRAMPALQGALVAGVTDLHANFSPAMAANADLLLTYRCNPHTDARAAAIRAAYLLDRMLRENLRPATVLNQVPLILPPTLTATGDEPMRTLEAMARRTEDDLADILAVNVHAGFAFGDTPGTGVSITAVTVGNAAAANAVLRLLSATALEVAARAAPSEVPLADAMTRLADAAEGPILLVEPSDNIGGGALGDGAALLCALAAHHIDNAAVVICDPDAVAALSTTEIGSRMALDIGGYSSEHYGGPCRLDAELISRSDGRFTLEDPQSHLASMSGLQVDMGPCAVVRHEGIRILLTSRPTPPFDLGQLRSQGIEPETLFAIGIKAAVAHRRAYDPIARESITVLTPGPCSSDLNTLPYRHIRRPIAPLG